MTPVDAISGFHATGVFPINRSVIRLPSLEYDDEEEELTRLNLLKKRLSILITVKTNLLI